MYFHNIKDKRGAHIKYFCDNPDYKIDEVYSTVSNYGTIRGFHKSLTQDKYIQCISGSAYIILVDEENNKITKKTITNEDAPVYVKKNTMWVGYQSLENNTIMIYMNNGLYSKDGDLAANPCKIELKEQNVVFEWPWVIDYNDSVISERDLQGKNLIL